MTASARGVWIAALAALAFGITTPVVAWAGARVGPFATAALLYAGAALSSFVLRVARPSGSALARGDAGRIVAIAIAGAAIAPILLAWGLQRTGATTGSLLLNLEAVFTVVLARVFYREPLGGRVAAAIAAMVAGGVTLAHGAAGLAEWRLAGVVAIAGATAAWALDNTLVRPLADHRDPLAIVAAKGALGASLSCIAAIAMGEHLPPVREACALVACGATGYGLSLRLYLVAQRRIGAARTGSVFALAPFVGAALAITLGDRALDASTAIAAALFVLGVVLHATEAHHHAHVHEAAEHEHPHRHDDGHHLHVHDPPVAGEHTHPHRHDRLAHDHDHAPDLHHDHLHDVR